MGHVFLSYSRRDAEQSRRLFSKLELVGVDVWLDRDGIRGGDQWRRQIVAAAPINFKDLSEVHCLVAAGVPG